MDSNKPNQKLFSEFPPVSTSEWEEVINVDLKGADYDKKLVWHTLEGFNVKPYYCAEDIENLQLTQTIPGELPYLRGTKTKCNCWEIRQDIDCEDPSEINAIAKECIAKGAKSIGFRVKNVTNRDAINTLFKDIDLTKIKINFISSRSYPALLELFIEYLNDSKINASEVKGSLNFDPLNFLVRYGKFHCEKEDNFIEAAYIANTIEKKLPGFRAINISGHTFANAGSTIVQELAFSLASGTDYLAELTGRGISIDKIVPRMQFTFAVGSNYFFEIAKMRAARLLWSKIVEQFKPENKDSQKMFIHAITLNWNKTVYDAHVNLLRTTTEAMSAIIGGIDSLAVAPFDVAYKASDDFSRRIARNQQIVLKEESYMNKIVDPAAGSYYIESITDQIASAAWALFKEVEELGGFMEAVQKNFIQDSIETVRKKKEDDIANRKVTILGTNQYPNPNETALDKIQEEEAATGKVEGKGNYKKLEFSRAAEELEEIRLATEIFVNERNSRPKVFLFTVGNLAMRKARASFATNFFGIAGYEIIDNPGFKTVDEGVKVAIDSKAEVIVICSSDEEYAEIAPAIAKAIKEKASERTVILAGYPKEIIDLLKAAGVDDFIHIKTNALVFLKQLQEKLGIME